MPYVVFIVIAYKDIKVIHIIGLSTVKLQYSISDMVPHVYYL